MGHADWKTAFGVFIALTSGILLNVGNLLQKRAVNILLEKKHRQLSAQGVDVKIKDISLTIKDLGTDKQWVFGFLFQAIIGSGLFIVGESLIGPTLTPLLGSFGLIVLVFASCFVKEKLQWEEYLGLAILFGAIIALYFSHTFIDLSAVVYDEKFFMIRVGVYTGVTIAICVFCKLWSYRKDRFESIALATLSGMLVALQNYWIAPMTSYAGHVVHHDRTMHIFDILYLLLAIGIVVVSNLQTVYERQLAFRVGTAATVIPISHIPSHLSSIVIYMYVYKKSSSAEEIAMIWIGVAFLIISSFIFAKRAAYFEGGHSERMEEIDPLLSASSLHEREENGVN